MFGRPSAALGFGLVLARRLVQVISLLLGVADLFELCLRGCEDLCGWRLANHGRGIDSQHDPGLAFVVCLALEHRKGNLNAVSN